MYVDDIKMTGKKAEYGSHVGEIDEKCGRLDEPTSFLRHVNLGCTQRECKPNEIIIKDHRKMFESLISAGATEKLSEWEKPSPKKVAWSYDMHGRTCSKVR